MRRLLSLCAAALLVALLPSPAVAGPIDLKDPIIGVRGGDFGSADITTTTPLFFGTCPGEPEGSPRTDLALAGFSCLAYKITDAYNTSGIFSVVLHIEDTVNGGPLIFSPADTSDSFFMIPVEGNPNRVQLSSNPYYTTFETAPSPFQCPNSEGSEFHPCHAGEDLLIYIKPDSDNGAIYTSSVEQINGQPVPEPATLLLLGTGMATIAGRRLRRNKTTT